MGNILKFYASEKEDGEKPGESEKEHYATDAEHHTQDSSCTDFFLFSSNSANFVSNKHHNDPGKDEEVEEHYCKDGSEKSTPEYFSMRDEAAVNKMIKVTVCKSIVV